MRFHAMNEGFRGGGCVDKAGDGDVGGGYVSKGRKRKTTSDVKDGIVKEEKKLRVEQVVTNLATNTTTKTTKTEYKTKADSPTSLADNATTTTWLPTPTALESKRSGHVFSSSDHVPFHTNRIGPPQRFVPLHPPVLQPSVRMPGNLREIPPSRDLTPLKQSDYVGRFDGGDVKLEEMSPTSVMRRVPVGGQMKNMVRVPRGRNTNFVVFKPELHHRPPVLMQPPSSSVGHSLSQKPPGLMSPTEYFPGLLKVASPISAFSSTSNFHDNQHHHNENRMTTREYLPPLHTNKKEVPVSGMSFPISSQPSLTCYQHHRDVIKKSRVMVTAPINNKAGEADDSRVADNTRPGEEQNTVPSNKKRGNLDNYPSELCEWTIAHVSQYFRGLGHVEWAEMFRVQEIDGECLMLLDEHNIARLLGVKMGPAIKLADLIRSLVTRTKMSS